VQKQGSINGHCDEEDEPSSWDARRPPLGGTAQARVGGAYGNGLNFTMKGIGDVT